MTAAGVPDDVGCPTAESGLCTRITTLARKKSRVLHLLGGKVRARPSAGLAGRVGRFGRPVG